MGKICFFLMLIVMMAQGVFATPVSDYGQLQVKDGQLCDAGGNEIQLRGMSMFWNNYSEAFWNPVVIKNLAYDWNMNVIRLAMGAADKADGGGEGTYFYDPDTDDDQVIEMVDAAIEAGIYVIIDWHGHYASNHTSDAKAFFAKMSEKYAGVPNVIYEVWNEPITGVWSTIKSYSETILSEIRANDPNSIVIVGTGFYCQQPDYVIGNEIDDDNVMYAIHVYADSHDNLYSPFNTAVNAGLPLFMSEWGTCDASGAGSVNESKSEAWIDWMNDNKISWCNWSVNNKDEAASALATTASTDGNWTNDDLSTSGQLIFNIIKNANPTYSDMSDLEVVDAVYSGNYVYLTFNKPMGEISTSDFSVSGNTVTSVELSGDIGDVENQILISLENDLSGDVSINIDVTDRFGSASLNSSVDVSANTVELPLKINIAGDNESELAEYGFVAETPYYTGKSAWGTVWGEANGGSDKTNFYTDFLEGMPELDPVMGAYMYGLESVNVSVANGLYKVFIFAIEDKTVGPDADTQFGYHPFNVTAEGELVVENYDPYAEAGAKYKIAICSLNVDVTDGLLNIELEGVSDLPLISAVIVGDEDYVLDVAAAVGDYEVVSDKLSMKLYPNPFNPIVNVSLNLPTKEAAMLKVYNLKGDVIYENNISKDGAKNMSVNMSKYASGVYMFRVTSANYVITKKAILLK